MFERYERKSQYKSYGQDKQKEWDGCGSSVQKRRKILFDRMQKLR
ncbi:hypothetical protein [Thermococcus sp.]|nr:hypothetical protein [Thermococcus sp.]